MKITKSNILTIILMLIPGLLIYLVLIVYPIIQSTIFSFYKMTSVDTKIFVGFKNFIGVFSDDIFWKSVKNTLLFMVGTTIFQIVLGFTFGYLLYIRLKGYKFFSIVLFIPAVLSSVAVGYIWGYILSPAFGLLKPFMTLIGLGQYYSPPLANSNLALVFAAVVHIWASLGVPIMMFNAGFMGMPEDVLEVASIDGACGWKKIYHMVIPLSWDIIKIIVILQVIGGLRSFDLIYVMTGGGPNHATEVLTMNLFNYAFNNFNLGYGSVVSIVIFFIAFTLTVVLRKSMFRESLQN